MGFFSSRIQEQWCLKKKRKTSRTIGRNLDLMYILMKTLVRKWRGNDEEPRTTRLLQKSKEQSHLSVQHTQHNTNACSASSVSTSTAFTCVSTCTPARMWVKLDRFSANETQMCAWKGNGKAADAFRRAADSNDISVIRYATPSLNTSTEQHSYKLVLSHHHNHQRHHRLSAFHDASEIQRVDICE